MVKRVSLDAYYEKTNIPLRLGCVTESGWPVVLSLWYLFEEGVLYCATPESARVVRYLTAEPRCSFEVASDMPPYCGVRGKAIAVIDKGRGIEILERLLVRYVGSVDNPLAKTLLNRSVPEVAIRLEPQRMFTWDFSGRMTAPSQYPKKKYCPD